MHSYTAKWGFETFLWEIPGDILPLATSKPFLCSYTGESGDLVPVASSIAVGTYAGNTRQGLNVVAVGGKLVRIRQVCVHSGGIH